MAKKGRPNKFNDPKKLQKIIDEWFENCKETGEYPTVAGLAVLLNTSRKVLYEYQNFCDNDDKLKNLDESVKREISNVIKRAKAKIESSYVQQLFRTKNPAGVIFILKNDYGYKDKQEVEQTNRVIKVSIDDSDDE